MIKISKYVLFISILLMLCGSFYLGVMFTYKTKGNQLENTSQDKNGGIPKQYFDFDVLSSEDTTSYVELGKAPSQDVSDIGYTTVPRQLVQDENDGSTVTEADIDNDKVDEQAILKSVSMTHAPHQLQIVKDNLIIFESSPMGDISFAASPSHNGFYLYGTPQDQLGNGYRIIRFAWVDGKLAPVWQQWVSYWQYRE